MPPGRGQPSGQHLMRRRILGTYGKRCLKLRPGHVKTTCEIGFKRLVVGVIIQEIISEILSESSHIPRRLSRLVTSP
jgi:hypothetical protein